MWTDRAENPAVKASPGDAIISLVDDYVEPPVRTSQLRILLDRVQEEVDRGDIGVVVEIGKGFWKEFLKRGCPAIGGEAQTQ